MGDVLDSDFLAVEMEKKVKLVGLDDGLDTREERKKSGVTSTPDFFIVQLSWCQIHFPDTFENNVHIFNFHIEELFLIVKYQRNVLNFSSQLLVKTEVASLVYTSLPTSK